MNYAIKLGELLENKYMSYMLKKHTENIINNKMCIIFV